MLPRRVRPLRHAPYLWRILLYEEESRFRAFPMETMHALILWGFAKRWFPKGCFFSFGGCLDPKNRNEGTQTGTMDPKNRKEGTQNGTMAQAIGTRAQSRKPTFYKTALLFPLGSSVFFLNVWFAKPMTV